MKLKSWAFALLCAATVQGTAYDVKNPALNKVNFQKPENHEEITLVKNGKLNFAIVTDKNIEKNIRDPRYRGIERAVKALSENIGKCTGQQPEILDVSETDKIAKYPFRVLVGDSAMTRALGIDARKLPREGFIIKTFKKGIAIVGNDSSLDPDFNKDKLDSMGPRKATLWGVYDFLERFFGCRYFFPGELGTLQPEVKNLVIAPVAYTDQPHFMNRSEEFIIWSMMGNKKAEWEKLLGPVNNLPEFIESWRLARTTPFWAGHNPRPEKILASYPDKKDTLFYRAPNGNLYYNPKQHIGNYFDVTNLGFADLLVESLKKYYTSNGKVNDGWVMLSNSYIPFGQCDSEVPLPDMINNPTVVKEKLITEENIKRGFSYSDIYARFYQYFGNRVKKELPGKKIVLLPYSNYTRAPLNPKWSFPDNIELRVCVFDFPAWTRNKDVVAKWQENIREWTKALGGRPVISLWLYNVPNNEFARAVSPQFIGEIPKLLGKNLGNMDMFFDQYGGFEYNYYYAQYAGARGMWDPDFDVAAAIDEHWEPFYGKEAGQYLRQFHKLLLDSYLKYFIPQKTRNPLYPLPVINEMDSLLAKAGKAVKPGSIEEKRYQVFAKPWKNAFESQRNRHSYNRPVAGAYQLLSGEKITVDGKGDEPLWNKAKPLNTVDPLGINTPRKYPSDIRLAWDKSGLYGRIISPYPPLAKPGNSVWNNSNVEIFLSPGTKQEDFFQYAIDPLNRRHFGTKQFVPVEKPFNGYWKSPGFKSAVRTSEKGWALEFFVPYEDLKVPAPKAYDTWLLNIVTNKNSDPKEYSSTAMTLGNNHNIGMFGYLKFLGKGE